MRPRLVRVFVRATTRFNAEAGTFMAPSIAYNIISSAVPVTLVAVATLAFIYGDSEGIERVRQGIHVYVPQMQTLLTQNLNAAVRYRGLSGIIGLLSLIWAGKNLFGALIYALNRAFDISKYRFFVWDIAIAIIMVPLVGIVVVLATAVPVAITLVVQLLRLEWLRWIPQIASYAASLLLIFFVFTFLYAYLPNRKPCWPAILIGSSVSSVGYVLAQIAFAVYTSYAASAFAIYGALSAVFGLLLWLYYSSVVFLFGAFVSAAWEYEKTSDASNSSSSPSQIPPVVDPTAEPG